MRLAPFLLLAPLAACLAGGDEAFPSLLPRPGETARDLSMAPTAMPDLSPPERARLEAAFDASGAALDRLVPRLAEAAAALARTAAAARGAPPGSEPWVEAEIARSRLETERAALALLASDLAVLAPLLELLAETDPLRMRHAALGAATARAEAETDAALRAAAANIRS